MDTMTVDTLIFWLYLANAILLTIHEMDSAYWKEWELFRMPGGAALFLLLHVPILLFIFYGLVLVHGGTPAGHVFSLVLSGGGLFAFTIHTYFLRKGDRRFDAPVSRIILTLTLVVSLAQAAATVYRMVLH